MVKNPNFHDAASVKLDKIVYYPTEDISEEFKRFRANELDVTNEVPTDQVRRSRRSSRRVPQRALSRHILLCHQSDARPSR